MSELVDTLQSLLQICRDGSAFYRETADKVDDTEAKATIEQMVRVRERLIEDFAGLLEQRGEEVPDSGTLVGTMQKLYADLRARFSGNADGIYISQLEEAEDRLLHRFEDAIVCSDSAEAKEVLRRYVPLARAAHERMRQLKRRKSA